MIFRRYRLPIIGAVAAAVFALLIGAQGLLFQQQIGSPLDEVMVAFSEVTGYEVEERPSGLVVTVSLDRVDNLYDTHRRLAAGIEKRLDRPVELHIRDQRHQELESVWYTLHHELVDAELAGGYAALGQRLQALEERGFVERARLYIDQQKVYVQLMDDRGYLYEVLPRPQVVVDVS